MTICACSAMARDTLQLGNIRHCAKAANAAVGCAQGQSEMSRGMAGQRDFKPHVSACWKMQVRRKPQYMDAQKRPDGRVGAGARHAALGRDAERGSVTTRSV